MTRRRAYLDLIRLPNLFTAAADPIAGALCAGASAMDWHRLIMAGASGACLYAGGVVLNDVADADRDAEERPDRPIPSRRVARRTATTMGAALLAAGIGIAGWIDRTTGGIAMLLALCILSYDFVTKGSTLGPVNMGACRALNLALGAIACGAGSANNMALPMLTLGLYTTSITWFARDEAGRSDRRRLAVAGIGLLASVAAAVAWPYTVARAEHAQWWFGVALAGLVTERLVPAWRTASASAVQLGVRRFVLCLVLLDATLVAGARGATAGLALLGLLLPAWLSARWLRVT